MKTLSRWLFSASLLLLVGGCATPPPPFPPATDLFSDATFHAPAQPLRTDQLFALSPAMRAKIDNPAFRASMRRAGPEHGLVDALYNHKELQLDYEASVTRDAAGTFAEGKGNCLSLVIMTAAFAKALELDVIFQSVLVEEQWSRSGDIYMASHHVNLSLPLRNAHSGARTGATLTIDFLPAEDAERFGTRSIEEQTIMVMYMNNRAAEELAAHNLDQAYWWARAAIEKDPSYVVAYNTLGVIYQRHGDMALAERAFRRALVHEPENTNAMSNLIPVLASLGKQAESQQLAAQLLQIQPTPPFYYFQRGMKAMREARYADARDMFQREVKRSPYYHEFHFWLAIAHLRLGDSNEADNEITRALDTSTSDNATRVYSAKLAYMRAQRDSMRRLN
ncbi:MAG: tetratricopeptide repeat protein [Pseudomonadota bacterium]